MKRWLEKTMNDDILPLKTALFWIFICTLMLSGTTGAGIWIYKWFERQAATSGKYQIMRILQRTADKEPLETAYLAELLSLSVDRAPSLTSYSLSNATQMLLSSPCIQSASLKKVFPNTLCVDYAMRRPVAFLGEYENALIDGDGVPIPRTPFYGNIDLPEIILGEISEEVSWGRPITCKALTCALETLNAVGKACNQENMTLKRVDFSRENAPSAGQCEILVTIEDHAVPITYFLRLSIDRYEKNLHHFVSLHHYLHRYPQNFSGAQMIVDLRVPQLAFLSPVN